MSGCESKRLTRREALATSLRTASVAAVGSAAWTSAVAARVADETGRERWLIVSAHPDDESKASALILTERKPDDKLIILEMRLCGEGRPSDRKSWTREEAIEQRSGEMEQAATHLKADDLRWWLPPHPENENIAKTPETVAKMVELLKEIKPTRIITQWREDHHPDHVATAEIVDEAVKRLDVADGLTTVYYFGQPGQEEKQPNFTANHHVDISNASALAYVLWSRCVHRSQMSFRTMDMYLKYYKEHGRKAGVEYAAGYVMRKVQAVALFVGTWKTANGVERCLGDCAWDC